jgi:hypothetical protein
MVPCTFVPREGLVAHGLAALFIGARAVGTSLLGYGVIKNHWFSALEWFCSSGTKALPIIIGSRGYVVARR